MGTKKNARIAVVIVCGIALLLLWSGCKKESDEQPTKPPEPSNISAKTDTGPAPEPAKPDKPPAGEPGLKVVPLAAVGPVAFGMSKEQVIELLGAPERDEGIALWYLGSKGLHVVLDPRRGVHQIHCWSTDFPMPPPEKLTTFAGKTEQGIGMGASREEIVAAYGQPDTDEEKGGMAVLNYERLKTSFTLSQNKLVSLKLDAP
ncbi:MAG: hypothetical protein ACYTEX_23845 [Planctomycetota bacterium]